MNGLTKMQKSNGRISKTPFLENNLGDYLPQEANKLIDGALKQRLVYHWNGSRMVKN